MNRNRLCLILLGVSCVTGFARSEPARTVQVTETTSRSDSGVTTWSFEWNNDLSETKKKETLWHYLSPNDITNIDVIASPDSGIKIPSNTIGLFVSFIDDDKSFTKSAPKWKQWKVFYEVLVTTKNEHKFLFVFFSDSKIVLFNDGSGSAFLNVP